MLRWVLYSLMMSVCRAQAQTPRPLPPDFLFEKKASGVHVRVIEVDLTDKRVQVSVQTASGFPHGAESFSTLLARTNPTIAINGTYFSVDNSEPIGDVVVGGKQLYRGFMGTALAITHDKQASIQRLNRGGEPNWKDYETVLACGPALVLNGRVDVRPEEEGFQDPHIMGATQRMGVGLTVVGHLLLVQTLDAVTFRKWADVMLALGCQNAMNLDAGASAAMYYRGRVLRSPGRDLTNLLTVYISRPLPDFTFLAPGPATRSGSLADRRERALRSAVDPGDSPDPTAKWVRLCGDTFQKATDFCPTTVLRRMPKKKHLGTCRLHASPH